jgi:hypothetical protein
VVGPNGAGRTMGAGVAAEPPAQAIDRAATAIAANDFRKSMIRLSEGLTKIAKHSRARRVSSSEPTHFDQCELHHYRSLSPAR